MTNTMTPSEIADALASRRMYGPDSGKLDAQAAATIRDLEVSNAVMVEVLSNSQAGGLECRAQLAVAWSKLKIATEALEGLSKPLGGPVHLGEAIMAQSATQALARIKEV